MKTKAAVYVEVGKSNGQIVGRAIIEYPGAN
jgi:hypothetical protein